MKIMNSETLVTDKQMINLNIQPLFIDSQSQSLFAMFWLPENPSCNHVILHVPAFAEEMNKSRRMVASQSRAMAKLGFTVLVLDLFGTGDSQGEFSEATWEIWLQNIADAILWLKQHNYHSITLWGLRTGALLAMSFIDQHPGLVDGLLAWQPVLNGDLFANQFLRLRIAAGMMNKNQSLESTGDLKKILFDGQALEVAGYMLNPNLFLPMMALHADRLSFHGLEKAAIFEWTSESVSKPCLVTQEYYRQLLVQNVNVSLDAFIGLNFWASQEIVIAPKLIELTNERLEQWLNEAFSAEKSHSA